MYRGAIIDFHLSFIRRAGRRDLVVAAALEIPFPVIARKSLHATPHRVGGIPSQSSYESKHRWW
ncbi:hypothetical protein [Photorhabdus luminescens]|uniref:hypothetical protein n=1 Tax=Photorhabdus luminescens TaxID=29488 RepID=UPI0010470376|nr:hypothetical protein [Photorhabdus luminescens]